MTVVELPRKDFMLSLQPLALQCGRFELLVPTQSIICPYELSGPVNECDLIGLTNYNNYKVLSGMI